MTALPPQYRWLAKEGSPRLLVSALQTFGTVEAPGPQNNPAILAWAKRAGLSSIYKQDSDAWCGLWMAYTALQAGWTPPPNPLGAQSWLLFGNKAPKPMLGDVLVFWRESPKSWKGHVGIYVGEDAESYHVLGGNQQDSVSIARVAKSRLLQARRCPWLINQPSNVRRVTLSASGALSKNEA